MGFSNVVSQVILFMSVLLAVVMLSIVYKGYITTSNTAFETQNERLVQRFDTSFDINSADYSSAEKKVTIELENTGSIKLDPEMVDVFVDDERIGRDSSLREVSVVKNIINDKHWDSGERLSVNVTKDLESGSHLVRLASENGVTRSVVVEV